MQRTKSVSLPANSGRPPPKRRSSQQSDDKSAQAYLGMSDYTVTSGFMNIKEKFLGHSRWVRWFVILTKDAIHIFENETSKVPRKSMDLTGYKDVECYAVKSKCAPPWGLILVPGNSCLTTEKFSCISERDRKQWMEYFKQCIYQANSQNLQVSSVQVLDIEDPNRVYASASTPPKSNKHVYVPFNPPQNNRPIGTGTEEKPRKDEPGLNDSFETGSSDSYEVPDRDIDIRCPENQDSPIFRTGYTLERMCDLYESTKSREDLLNGLRKKPPGTYLLRSSRSGPLQVISYHTGGGDVEEYKMFYTNDRKKLTIDPARRLSFVSTEELLREYTLRTPLHGTDFFLKQGFFYDDLDNMPEELEVENPYAQ